MTQADRQNIIEIVKINNVSEKFFYLQGGLDYTKLKGIKKIMLKLIENQMLTIFQIHPLCGWH